MLVNILVLTCHLQLEEDKDEWVYSVEEEDHLGKFCSVVVSIHTLMLSKYLTAFTYTA